MRLLREGMTEEMDGKMEEGQDTDPIPDPEGRDNRDRGRGQDQGPLATNLTTLPLCPREGENPQDLQLNQGYPQDPGCPRDLKQTSMKMKSSTQRSRTELHKKRQRSWLRT